MKIKVFKIVTVAINATFYPIAKYQYGTFMLLWLKLLRQLTELSPHINLLLFLNTKPPQIATM